MSQGPEKCPEKLQKKHSIKLESGESGLFYTLSHQCKGFLQDCICTGAKEICETHTVIC